VRDADYEMETLNVKPEGRRAPKRKAVEPEVVVKSEGKKKGKVFAKAVPAEIKVCACYFVAVHAC
jgi:hypothetical protein